MVTDQADEAGLRTIDQSKADELVVKRGEKAAAGDPLDAGIGVLPVRFGQDDRRYRSMEDSGVMCG